MHEPDIQHDFEHLDEPEQSYYDYDQLIASDSSAAAYSTFSAEFNGSQNSDAQNPGTQNYRTNPVKPKSQPSSSRPHRSNHSTTTTNSSPLRSKRSAQNTDSSDQNRHRSRLPQLRIPILISLLLGLASLSTILFLFISSHTSRPAPISVITTLRDRSGDHFLYLHSLPLPSHQPRRQRRR